MAEESSRFYAQHKRNVSFTASMIQFQLNQIDGIPTWYNIAVIDDIVEGLFTIDGNTNKAKPYDGATFVNPIIMYLENNSLNESRAGIHKKQFVHFYDEMTGTGGIIKTAGFALTNNFIRSSIFYRDMMQNMTDRKWFTEAGSEFVTDITEDYKGNKINYGTFYYKMGSKYYQASIEKADGDNAYFRYSIEVNNKGEVIANGETKSETFIVDTNFKLWNLFGGMRSCSFDGNVLKGSEDSLLNVVKAVINVGVVKDSGRDEKGFIKNDITAEHIDQPLKNADIHYIPTIGAVKQGSFNMNPSSFYKGIHNFNTSRIRMTNAGIQLDKEHHADGSKLSLMTQVISAACSMGYTPKVADRLYKALYKLTLQGIKPFKQDLIKYLGNPSTTDFDQRVANSIVKTLMTSTARDGDMLRAIASNLIGAVREGRELTREELQTLPYSEPTVFPKLVSSLSVLMTKLGVKAKMDGILSVLCPTQGIIKKYTFFDKKINKRRELTLDQLENLYDDDFENIITSIQEDQPSFEIATIPDLQDWVSTNIEIGAKYKVVFENNTEAIIDIKVPHDTGPYRGASAEVMGYQAFKNLLSDGYAQYGNVKSVQEYVVNGRELASINFKFIGSDGTTTRHYQLWDVDYIQRLFQVISITKGMHSIEDRIKEYEKLIIDFDGNLNKFNSAQENLVKIYKNEGIGLTHAHRLKLLMSYAKQLQQDILFTLSKNNPDKVNKIRIGGKMVTVDKESIVTSAYELVMPKVFLEEFGLENNTSLDEIIQNKDYFYEKMVSRFDTKVYDDTYYDIELKRVNGNHIYIKDRADIQNNVLNDLEKVSIYTETDEEGNIWRYDLRTGQKLYQMFDASDEVYRIKGTDIEIIVTSSKKLKGNTTQSGITFYLDSFKYQSIHISEAIAAGIRNDITERPKFDDMLNMIAASNNSTANKWLSAFKLEDGWVENRVQLNVELNTFSNISDKLQSILKEQARIVHSSLLKSLEVIAARIPAQNQQSFMPMRVIAWENPNINTAYVSIMQFFLQGSDLDIDAVSLLMFSFDSSGEFYKWSPEFDMNTKDLLDASLNLPFPSGEEVKVVVSTEEDTYIDSDKRNPITDQAFYHAVLSDMEKREAGEYDKLGELEQEAYRKQELLNFAKLIQYIEDNNNTMEFNTREEATAAQKLIDRINKHQLYLENSKNNKKSDELILGAIKNYTVASIMAISTDAANMLEAHMSVDVATDLPKSIAAESELSKVQKTFTPGNVCNKFQAIEEAAVGKDDIAICATGMKGFFAATQFCNSYLNANLQNKNITTDLADQVASIIKFNDVTIGGKNFNTLANIRVSDITKIPEGHALRQILEDKKFEDDASVIMSALLSLSTDNAKELCLAKINAGTNMMGLYLYGAAIGMDFKVMNQIIASPVGFTIAKIMSSNEFTQQSGKTSVNSALEYLKNGPSKHDLKRFKGTLELKTKEATDKITVFSVLATAVNKLLENDENLKDMIHSITNENPVTHHNIGKVIAQLVATYGTETAYNFLDKVKTEMANVIKPYENHFNAETINNFHNFRALAMQLNSFLVEFVGQTATLLNTDYTTDYGTSNIVEDLNKLALGADEFKRLGQFLRLNQEIKTRPDELISFVQNIENLIVDRVKIIKSVAKRSGELPEGMSSQLDELKSFDFIKFANSFLTDPDNPNAYHNQQIELYEQYCKTCINPLRILTTVSHYKGYLESMIISYEGAFNNSVKFRSIKRLGNQFINIAKVSKGSEKIEVFKGVQNFVDEYINNAFLRSQPPIKLPKASDKYPVKIISKYGSSIDNDFDNTYIQLGTESGNKTFEVFFETVVIPALKEKYPNNRFIQELTDQMIIDSVTGSRYIAKTLPINMMPSSDSEMAIFNTLKNDFNALDGNTITIGNNHEYGIIKMFYQYNLLKFKGRAGTSSLAKIFEDVIADHEYLKAYRTFTNAFDRTYDFTIINAEPLETSKISIPIEEAVLYKYLAPMSNIYSATSDIIKYRSYEQGEVILLKRKEDDDKTPKIVYNDDTSEHDVIGDDNQEDRDVDDNDHDDPENTNFSSEKYSVADEEDYGDFVPLEGDGVLDRFNPPTSRIEDSPHQIYETYVSGDNIASDLVIIGGALKQITVAGTRHDIPGFTRVLEIRDDGQRKFVLNHETIDTIIEKLKNCPKK